MKRIIGLAVIAIAASACNLPITQKQVVQMIQQDPVLRWECPANPAPFTTKVNNEGYADLPKSVQAQCKPIPPESVLP